MVVHHTCQVGPSRALPVLSLSLHRFVHVKSQPVPKVYDSSSADSRELPDEDGFRPAIYDAPSVPLFIYVRCKCMTITQCLLELMNLTIVEQFNGSHALSYSIFYL